MQFQLHQLYPIRISMNLVWMMPLRLASWLLVVVVVVVVVVVIVGLLLLLDPSALFVHPSVFLPFAVLPTDSLRVQLRIAPAALPKPIVLVWAKLLQGMPLGLVGGGWWQNLYHHRHHRHH
jgi:hypothetical protein